ncbi:MAG: 3',5'-cyclic-AMP phosphodiesterase [Acidobacteriota bacterium]
MPKPSQDSTSTTSNHSVQVLHITDSHLFAERTGRLLGVMTYDSLMGVLADAATNPPDIVLATGDLAQDGTAQAYGHLTEAFSCFAATCSPPPPVYWLPGNHDEPAVMCTTLTQPPLRSDTEVVVGGWYFILLDSTIPGEVGGALSKAELERLDAGLRAHAHCPALVCLHHNPVATCARWMDDIGLANADAFFAILDGHPQVRGVLWGHVHQAMDIKRHSMRLMASPSTCIQFKPETVEFGLDSSAPGYRRLWLYPDGRLETQVFRVSNCAGCADPNATGY